jgi:hypothetical protein
MDDRELYREMFNVCVATAMLGPRYGPQFRLDSIEYAKLIERVSRKLHGGKSQQVMRDLLTATAKGSTEGCERVNEARDEALKRQKPR